MTALEKQQKKISVIIPVYNAEKYIRAVSYTHLTLPTNSRV